MKWLRTLGTGLAAMAIFASNATAQSQPKWWTVEQLGATVPGTLLIEFHAVGTVADTCNTYQLCPGPGTFCVTAPIPVGPAVDGNMLAQAIVTPG